MFDNYRSVLRIRGTANFCAAGFVMRLPIAVYPIGLVLLVSVRTGHYGFAGVLSASYIAGGALGNPVLARAVDRRGQHGLLLPAAVVHVASTVVLILLAQLRTPDWSLVIPAFVSGFSFISVTSLVRSRWSYALRDRPGAALDSAYSLESVLDEIMFVVGPIIATAIATHVDPVFVFVLAAALVGIGSMWLRAQRATEPPIAPATDHLPGTRALSGWPVRIMLIAMVGMGMTFASAEVTMVAFCGQHGLRGVSGAVLACFAGGSGISALVYGSRAWRRPVVSRFRIQGVVFGLLPLLFLIPRTVPVLAVCALVVGTAIGPALITAFGLVQQLVATRSLTEGLAWLVTGLNVGYGIGSAVVGGIADADGASTAFLVAIGAALLVGVTGFAVHATATREARVTVPG